MNKKISLRYFICLSISALFNLSICGQVRDSTVISREYSNFWNAETQAKIDRDIERNRKADAFLDLDIRPGTKVRVEQTSHQFLFGANIFLFGDLKTPDMNARYESTFGSLFNAATIPFYWKTLEPEQGKPRYEAGSSYEYRRPPPDPVIDFCESKGINMNGHPIIYGMRKWAHPVWMPDDRKAMEPIFQAHVRELAERYQGRLHRWDVVNEPIDQANRGLMPDDYTYKTFIWAMRYFPEAVKFNINDCDIHSPPTLFRRYVELIRNLTDRGIRIDNVGVQMHIFNPEESRRIAGGEDALTPDKIYEILDCLKEAERPVHISEVTVSAPDDTETGSKIQAEITKNLYRLWFSYPSVMGITWWNVVDGGAAPGEPSFSGIYDKMMAPKTVYHILDDLINHQWETNITVTADKNGSIRFRGFRGNYLLSWKEKGKEKSMEFRLD